MSDIVALERKCEWACKQIEALLRHNGNLERRVAELEDNLIFVLREIHGSGVVGSRYKDRADRLAAN